jgi:hypothetical protein
MEHAIHFLVRQTSGGSSAVCPVLAFQTLLGNVTGACDKTEKPSLENDARLVVTVIGIIPLVEMAAIWINSTIDYRFLTITAGRCFSVASHIVIVVVACVRLRQVTEGHPDSEGKKIVVSGLNDPPKPNKKLVYSYSPHERWLLRVLCLLSFLMLGWYWIDESNETAGQRIFSWATGKEVTKIPSHLWNRVDDQTYEGIRYAVWTTPFDPSDSATPFPAYIDCDLRNTTLAADFSLGRIDLPPIFVPR